MTLIDIKSRLNIVLLCGIVLIVNSYLLINETLENVELSKQVEELTIENNTKAELINKQEEELRANEDIINQYRLSLQEYSNKLQEFENLADFTVTAYDLSEQSCGKSLDHPLYGITATGFDLSNHSLETAKTIAVDPDVIPLGSKVLIKFLDNDVKQYSGVYVARDTGGAINGNKIDLFVGDTRSSYPSSRALEFGVKRAKIKVIG